MKQRYLFLLICLSFISGNLLAQQTVKTDTTLTEILIVEEKTPTEQAAIVRDSIETPDGVLAMPLFMGQNAAYFSRWAASKVQYPSEAQENGIQGRVIIEFIIDKLGKMTEVKVLRSVDALLDDEAVRVIKSSPDWEPGILNNEKTVPVRLTVPITFKLQ